MATAEELAALGIHIGDEDEPSQSELFYDDGHVEVETSTHAEPGHDSHATEAAQEPEQHEHDHEDELFYEESLVEHPGDQGKHTEAAHNELEQAEDVVAEAAALLDTEENQVKTEELLAQVGAMVNTSYTSQRKASDPDPLCEVSEAGEQLEPSAGAGAMETAATTAAPVHAQAMDSNPHLTEMMGDGGRRMSSGPSLEDELKHFAQAADFSDSGSDQGAGAGAGTEPKAKAEAAPGAEFTTQPREEAVHTDTSAAGADTDADAGGTAPAVSVAASTEDERDRDSSDSDLDEASAVRLMTTVPMLPNVPVPAPGSTSNVDVDVPKSFSEDDDRLLLVSDNDKIGVPLEGGRDRCCGTGGEEDACIIL